MAENEQCSRCGVKYTHGFAFGKFNKIDDELVCANCLTKEETDTEDSSTGWDPVGRTGVTLLCTTISVIMTGIWFDIPVSYDFSVFSVFFIILTFYLLFSTWKHYRGDNLSLSRGISATMVLISIIQMVVMFSLTYGLAIGA